ncbi:UNVERIFIED_ORG: endonuclease YncB(thermonuclease family) [Comamonas terrigena]
MLATTLLCLVGGISDGDTLTARCGQPGAYEQVKVRIHAIDAPERKQPFGNRSRESLSDLCFQQQARIQHQDTDRYGRTVASVECRGKDVAQHQVSTGMAWVYVKYAKRRSDLFALEKQAQQAGAGLWRDTDAVAPWGWRRAATGR